MCEMRGKHVQQIVRTLDQLNWEDGLVPFAIFDPLLGLLKNRRRLSMKTEDDDGLTGKQTSLKGQLRMASLDERMEKRSKLSILWPPMWTAFG